MPQAVLVYRNSFNLSAFFARLLASLLLLTGLSLTTTAHGWPQWQPGKDRSGAEQIETLAPGKLLVAMPQQRDPHFRGTVVLLLRYNRHGAIGLIINRPTKLTLESEFEGQVDKSSAQHRLYWGGPVAMNHRLMLFEQQQPDDSLAGGRGPLLEQLYLAHTRGKFRALLRQRSDAEPQRFRIYAGYSGWGPRQLELEVIHGQWLVLPGDTELVLESDSESIWDRLMRYHDGRMAQLDQPPALAGLSFGSPTASAADG